MMSNLTMASPATEHAEPRHGWGIVMRIMAAILCAAATWAAYSWIVPDRADSASTPTEVVSYTVMPGDTLWRYAQMITPPGGDVSERVDELMRLNDLDSASLQIGQRIIVPVERAS